MYVSLGIMAYNEEKNIRQLLQSLQHQQLATVRIREIIVVSSGSTDQTEKIVQEATRAQPHLRLITQAKREGKASAVNLFLREATSSVIVLVSADLRLEPTTLETLVAPLADAEIGLTGAHPIPINDRQTFLGFAAHLLWELHHQIAVTTPKMGEMIAFRKIFEKIPTLSAVDEANIEPLIRGQGYRSVYVSEAIIWNKGPTTLRQFIAGRRRIYAGHLATKYDYSYQVATLSPLRIGWLLIRHWPRGRWTLLWTPAVVLLEAYARWLGWLDYRVHHRSHTIWEVTTTSKDLP